jgi:hypothetical protein
MYYFMDRSVEEAKKVIIVMTPGYKLKSERPPTGVGYEYSLMGPDLMHDPKLQAAKYIPILRGKDKVASIPFALRGKLYLDLSDEIMDEAKFRDLLTQLKGLKKKPQTYHPEDIAVLTKPFTAKYRNVNEIRVELKESEIISLMEVVIALHPFHERLNKKHYDLQDIFEKWWKINPQVFRLAYKSSPINHAIKSFTKKLIGFTCVLPLSEAAYLKYKSGKLSEWNLGDQPNEILIPTLGINYKYLLIQSIELSKEFWDKDTYGMAIIFSLLRHIANFNNDPVKEKMVLIADGNTKGSEMLESRGFHKISYENDSVDKRPRYQLDFGDTNLSARAQTTINQINEFLTSYRRDNTSIL